MRNTKDGQPLNRKYIDALYEHQKDFLKSITAKEEDAERYRRQHPDWLKEAQIRDGNKRIKS